MKRLFIWISILWSAQLFADGYPQSLIEADLESARRSTEVDLSGLKAGELRIVQYAGSSIWIYRRSEADLEYLRSGYQGHLANPKSEGFLQVIEDQYSSSTGEVWLRLWLVSQPGVEKERFRSLADQYLIVNGHSPLGCSLKNSPPEQRPHPAAPFWDVCSGLRFDVAGRLLKSGWTPPRARASELAGGNLLIPPHYFTSATKLVIGLRPSEPVPEVDLASIRARVYARLDPALKLVYAAAYNDIEEVRRGLKARAYTQTTHRPPNPLNAAIVGGSMELVELLLSHGFYPDEKSLEAAEFAERSEVIKLLEGFGMRKPGAESSRTPMQKGR